MRNGQLNPRYSATDYSLVAIGSRSVNSLIRTQGVGDLYRIYLETQRDGLEFFLAYIPNTFKEEPAEAFDKAYMRKLYQLGYDQAVSDHAWETAPPGYD